MIRPLARVLRVLGLFVIVAGSGLTLAPPASAEPSRLASEVVAGVNRARLEAGLPLLAEHGGLGALALERSADMAGRNYFSHTTPEGVDVFGLMRQRGFRFRAAGENLAWSTYPEREAPSSALRSWLDSPPHRANMLSPEFNQIGVGVASAGGKTYFTLVLIG